MAFKKSAYKLPFVDHTSLIRGSSDTARSKSLSKCLEKSFCHVMVISGIQDLQVKIHSGTVRYGIEKFTNHFGIHCSEEGTVNSAWKFR